MKRLHIITIAAALCVFLTPLSQAKSKSSDGTGSNPDGHYVQGYTKKDGKKVGAYKRSDANGVKRDNYSKKGNKNPSTGKAGTQ
jgi:hypothetical protein